MKKEPCANCGETNDECACLRNKCIRCGNPVGNITFTVCDKCWNKDNPRNLPKADAYSLLYDVRRLVELQDEYISHIENWIRGTAVFLDVHGVRPKQEDVDRGAELRTKIEELKRISTLPLTGGIMTDIEKIKKYITEKHSINCALTDEIMEFIGKVESDSRRALARLLAKIWDNKYEQDKLFLIIDRATGMTPDKLLKKYRGSLYTKEPGDFT